ELVRILHDEDALPFEEAVDIARGCLAYTNHTLLPEALERWSEGLFGRLLPRHLEIVHRIDELHARQNPSRKVSILRDGHVQMGELSFIMAHRVNGVSALHTELVKTTVFAELHRLHPQRIVNQTNGVTPRRWILAANPALSELIADTIGNGWVSHLERLSELEPHLADAAFLQKYAAAKRHNKARLSDWLRTAHGVSVDPEAMFDIQIKRIHEYKRQHMNILETIALWNEMRENPEAEWTPRVKIFGGKAAPGYYIAKEIIALINDVGRVINADPVLKGRLKVVFPPNYNVSMAERLIPAADLSEQISTAGKEASGTGNMKFAMNGALTIGTLDGANVEIRERVGDENFYLFGMTAEEVVAHRADPDHARRAIEQSPRLSRALDQIASGIFSEGDTGRYAAIVANLRDHDYFTVCSDFDSYWQAQRRVDADFRDARGWMHRAALNTARSGWFSSDRTIRGYMADIWNVTARI
ncbi:MAG: glycogen/starch/alpha-glucan family phosphorylase, partial [Rhodobacteraceae bacterium]|nr:glycogen/starch/alpha-glucan family phosphorylase [Paracoccaceae bacterium]